MNYHDIFVKKSIDAATLSNLEKYMFFHLPTTTTKHVEHTEPVTEELHLETHESMKMKDPLFWIIFMNIYGKAKYEEITKYTNTIMDEKQKIAQFFTERPNAMKNVNMKITKNKCKEIVSELMTNVEINMESIHALAIYYKRKICVFNDVVYYDIVPEDYDDALPTIYIYKKGKEYSLVNDATNCNVENLFRAEKHDSALKAISNYKVDELRALSQTLLLTPEKNDKLSHYIAIANKCLL